MRSSQYESWFSTRFVTALALGSVAVGLAMALRRWKHSRGVWPAPSAPDTEDMVDEAAMESFPASDPPSHTPVRGVRP